NTADTTASHRCDLARCFALQEEGRRLAERVGSAGFRQFFAGERVTELYLRGEWDEAVAIGDQLVEELSRHANPHFIQVPVRIALAEIAVGRGEDERAEAESSFSLERGRAIGDLQVLYSALAGRAIVLLDSGRTDEARAVVEEFLAH